jgi:hypothetical protein
MTFAFHACLAGGLLLAACGADDSNALFREPGGVSGEGGAADEPSGGNDSSGEGGGGASDTPSAGGTPPGSGGAGGAFPSATGGLGGGGAAPIAGGNAGTAGTAGAPPTVPTTMRVSFTPPGGTFVGTSRVEISSADQGVELRYTLDGSVPEQTSLIYDGPIELSASTRILVRAFRPGVAEPAGPIFAASYLRVADDVASFSSNLPIAIVHTFDSGKLDAKSSEFVPAWLSIAAPAASGRSALVGASSVQSGIGIHVRGQTSRGFPKKQYAVELRDDNSGEDRKLALLGMPAESDWVLSDSVVVDRSLIRNALAFAISNQIGRYAPRTRFVEAFLVDGGGDVNQSTYVGVYTLIEKIKRDSARVDVAKLEATELALPGISGGYIVSIDKGDPSFAAGGETFQFVYPDAELMLDAARAPQVDYLRDFIADFAEAVAAPDFIGPSHGQHYSEFIDVDAFIDHQIVNALAKNVDGLRISTYFHKDLDGPLVAGPVWDFDRSLGTPYDERASEPEEWRLSQSDGTDYFEEGFWGDLFVDPAFRTRYKQRFLTLLEGELSADVLVGLVDSLSAQLSEAAPRNFERWSDYPPSGGTHAGELAILKEFLQRRAAWIQTELEAWP